MHLGVIGLGAIGQALIAALDGREGSFGVTRLSLLARSESRATAKAHLTTGGPLARNAHVYTDATDLARGAEVRIGLGWHILTAGTYFVTNVSVVRTS